MGSREMARRAQMMGQVFVFILALVVFAGVLLYGYRAIFSVKQGMEDAAFISFFEDLRTRVDRVAIDYGSVKRFSAQPPQGFKEMCFLDLAKLERDVGDSLTDLRAQKPLIADAVESGTDQNLFFVPLAKTPTKLPPLDIEGGFLCIPIGEREISLRLEGLGDKTRLSEWK